MTDLVDLLLLLALLVIIGLWLKLSRARELATAEARRQCQRYGLQLLDETVGLSGLRLRRFNGQRRLERRYDFEVSIDGDDREPGRLWVMGDTLTELRLPTVAMRLETSADETEAPGTPGPALPSPTTSNVVPLRPRQHDHGTRH
jgi:hypothetical protein